MTPLTLEDIRATIIDATSDMMAALIRDLDWMIEAGCEVVSGPVPLTTEHRVIPAMRNGVLRHPPTCVNCDQPVEFPGSEWQHVAPSEP